MPIVKILTITEINLPHAAVHLAQDVALRRLDALRHSLAVSGEFEGIAIYRATPSNMGMLDAAVIDGDSDGNGCIPTVIE